MAPLYWKFGHQVCHLRLSYKFSHQVVPLALVRIFPPCVTTSKETSIPCQPPCHPPCLSPLSSSPYYGITNRQSYISKVLSRYLHSPGSHQLTWFLESVSDWLTHVGSIASHDAKKRLLRTLLPDDPILCAHGSDKNGIGIQVDWEIPGFDFQKSQDPARACPSGTAHSVQYSLIFVCLNTSALNVA